jgi:hypothetical protein
MTTFLQLIECFKTFLSKQQAVNTLHHNALYFLPFNLLSCDRLAAKVLVKTSVISENDVLEVPASNSNRAINSPDWCLSLFTSVFPEE